MVNAIPETVVAESYVRGRTFEAMVQANKRVNQAMTGTAYSIGTNIEIIDTPGYAPLLNDSNMINVAKEAYELLSPAKFSPFTKATAPAQPTWATFPHLCLFCIRMRQAQAERAMETITRYPIPKKPAWTRQNGSSLC